MKFPTPTRADHQRFCETEGWTPVRNAKGKAGHHITYELELPDGDVIRTRVSHPPGKQSYGDAMWGHILRDQLKVDEATFWACVRDGVAPPRGGSSELPQETLPVDLVHLLKTRLRLTDAQIAALNRSQAIELIKAFWQ